MPGDHFYVRNVLVDHATDISLASGHSIHLVPDRRQRRSFTARAPRLVAPGQWFHHRLAHYRARPSRPTLGRERRRPRIDRASQSVARSSADTPALKSDTFLGFFNGFSDKSRPNGPIDFKRQFCAVGTPLRLLLRRSLGSHTIRSTWPTQTTALSRDACWIWRVPQGSNLGPPYLPFTLAVQTADTYFQLDIASPLRDTLTFGGEFAWNIF